MEPLAQAFGKTQAPPHNPAVARPCIALHHRGFPVPEPCSCTSATLHHAPVSPSFCTRCPDCCPHFPTFQLPFHPEQVMGTLMRVSCANPILGPALGFVGAGASSVLAGHLSRHSR